jgi:hypothetical protein
MVLIGGSAAAALVGSPTERRRVMRVLLVEDEVHLAETVRQGLPAEGFNVEIVNDGTDGLWAAVLSAGDLTLDPARRRAERGRKEIQLTPREFSVLAYVMRNAGEVVTKTEILETCGTSTTTAIPTSSRSTSATCGARSTSRSARPRSRPYAGWATGSPATANERPAADP